MDFWKKYFTTKLPSDKDEGTVESADTAVNSLTRTTSKIMISKDDGDEDRVSSSRKRPISSVDYGVGKLSMSPSPTPSSPGVGKCFLVPPLVPSSSTNQIPLPSIPKPIPMPRIFHRNEEMHTQGGHRDQITLNTAEKYACPYCIDLELPEAALVLHVLDAHAHAPNKHVACPMCSARSLASLDRYTRDDASDFIAHIRRRHREPRQRETHTDIGFINFESSFLDENRDLSRSAGSAPSSGGVITLWDWLVQQDIAKAASPPTLRVMCFGTACQTVQIKQGEATCVLACGHTFHSSCLEMDQDSASEENEVQCPICNPPVHDISFDSPSTFDPLTSPRTPQVRKKVRK